MKDIWKIRKWEKVYSHVDQEIKSGVYLRIDSRVPMELRESLKRFCAWLRKSYVFPVRVPIYVKYAYKLLTKDGDLVYGTFFMPDSRMDEPYIRLAVGYYASDCEKEGKEIAEARILSCLVHELTHYFQWINDLNLTSVGAERQANAYIQKVLDEYYE